MSWVKLDPDMFDNDKVSQLSDRAYRVYVQAILWCVGRRTDGVVPADRWATVAGTRKWRSVVTELHAAGLIHRYGESCDSCDRERANPGIRPLESGDSHVHGILGFNPSNHEIRRRQQRDRGYKRRRSGRPTSPDGGPTVPIGDSDRNYEGNKAEGTRPHARIALNYPLSNESLKRARSVTEARAELAPDSPMSALIAAVRSVRPFWSPFDINEAAAQCASQGRSYTDTLAAFLRIADDPRITWPSRVVADGPWWRPVASPAHQSKSDARFYRTMERADQLEQAERRALEMRNGMRVLDGGEPE